MPGAGDGIMRKRIGRQQTWRWLAGILAGVLMAAQLFPAVVLAAQTGGDLSEYDIPDDAVTFNGHTYALFWVGSDITTLSEAEEACEDLGGHLATITSAEENEFLYNLMIEDEVESAFFGLTYDHDKVEWVWVTGEEVSYTNWANFTVESWGNHDYCGRFEDWLEDGEWFFADFSAEESRYVLCEWDVCEEEEFEVSVSAEYITSTDEAIVYEIEAVFSNNSDVGTVDYIFARLDPLDNASLLTDYGAETQYIETLAAGEETTLVWRIEIDRTAYPDGGAYYYALFWGHYSEESETLTSSEENVIYLAAVSSESNELDLDSDTWSFKNFKDSACELTDSLYMTLMDACTTSGQEYLKTMLEGGNNGHCYGMSAAVILQKMNAVDITTYTETDTLSEAKLYTIWNYYFSSSGYTREILCYYQLLQNWPAAEQARQDFMNEESDSIRLEILEEKVSAVSSGGAPVLLGFGSNEGAHAVVAYGLEEGEYTLSYTGRTYSHRILIYDCNYPGEERYFYYDVDEGTWEVQGYQSSYGFYSGSTKDGYLKRCVSDLSVIDCVDTVAGYYDAYANLVLSNETSINVSSDDGSWTIDGKSGSVTGTSNIVNYHEDGITEDGECGDRIIVLPSITEEYAVTTVSGEAEELELQVVYGDRYIYLSAEAACGLSFSADGAVTLAGNAGEFELRIADDEIPDGEFDVYYLTGDTAGDVVVLPGDEGISVSADSICGITIEAFEEDVTDTITIAADVTSAVFGRNDGDELSCLSHTAADAVQENLTEASCTESGSYESVVYCVICGKEISRTAVVLEATGHSYVDGVCSVCGDDGTSADGGDDTLTGEPSDGSTDTSGESSGTSDSTSADSSVSSGSSTGTSTGTSDESSGGTDVSSGETDTIAQSEAAEPGDSQTSAEDIGAVEAGAAEADDPESSADLTQEGETAQISDTDRGAAATGDDSSILLWLVVLLAAAAGMAGVKRMSVKW